MNVGFDQVQRAAETEMSKLKPWAETLEREMKPAMDRVEERLGSALDRLGMTFGRDRVDSHVMNTNGMPGIESFLGQSLDPFSIFGLTRQNWYEGPNVCIERKVINENGESTDEQVDDSELIGDSRRHGKFMRMDMSFTTCRDDFNYHECTTQISRNGEIKRVTVRHQCCYGYERSIDATTTGCTKLNMEDLKTTLQNMGVEEFNELLVESGIDIPSDQNVTIFVPSNDAIEDFRHDLEQLNTLDNDRNTYNVDDGLSYRKKRDITIVETPALDEILKAHMVEGFIDTADVHDEDLLKSLNDMNIRMTVYNTYPQRAVMANCAKVTSRDHFSTNGVVHIVDKVMMPATKTLKEMIETDVQLASLKAVLEKANLLDKLGENGQFTLLAPNNQAFSELEKDVLKKIERGNGCSKDILLHHLLPNVICSGVIENKAKTLNINDKYIILERNDEDQVSVDEATIVTRDIMGTNGVIHIIDKVLLPEAARTVEEVLEESHMTTLEELFKIAEMSEALDSMQNMTIFAPSEKALATLPKELLDDLKQDPARLKEFLMYHITTPKTCHCDMENNKLVKTGVPNKSLRINAYGGLIPFVDQEPSTYTVQCAKITHMDNEVCGGMIHTIDKVLMPPIGNLMQLLAMDPKHSKLVELIKFADMDSYLNDNAAGPFTIMAPTNGAFQNMDDETKEKIFEDKSLAEQVVKHHVLKEMLCCSGITRNFMFFDQSTKITLLDDDVLNVRRSNGGYLYADRAELTTCDMVADNGVVHSIDRVLLPLGVGPRVPQERAMYHHTTRFNPFDLIKFKFE